MNSSPGDETSRLEEAKTLLNIATDYRNYRWLVEAKRFGRRAMTTFERAVGPSDPRLVPAVLCLAGICLNRREYEESERLYRRAFSILNLCPGEAVTLDLSRLGFEAARGLAEVARALGRSAEAEIILKQALVSAERTVGRQSIETAGLLNDLAVCYKSNDELDKATEVFYDALGIAEAAVGRAHPQVAGILHNLAVLDLLRGRFVHGEPLARYAVSIHRRTLGPDHPVVAADIVTLAAILAGKGAHAEAESSCRTALTMFERWFGPAHDEVSTTLSCLSELVLSQGRSAEAEQMLYQRAVAILDRPDSILSKPTVIAAHHA